MKGGSFLQKMSKFGDYVFKLSIKDWGGKMMDTKLTIGMRRVCGFMRRARRAWLSTRARCVSKTSKRERK